MRDIATGILTNALEFLEEAAERVSSKNLNKRDLKFSILHVEGAVGLLLKSRLCLEHWALIFANVDDVDEKRLQSGDFQSLRSAQAHKRLSAIGVDLTEHQKLLVNLRKVRNKIQHYKEDYTQEQAQSILMEALSFVVDFVHSECLSMIESNVDIELAYQRIEQYLFSCEVYVEQRFIGIAPIIREANLVLECPSCLQDAVTPDGESEISCHFCHGKFQFEDFKSKWSSSMGYHEPQGKDASIDPPLFRRCPECGCEGLIEEEDGDMYPPDPAWFCVGCGCTWGQGEVHICTHCNEPYTGNGELGYCSECFEYRISRW